MYNTLKGYHAPRTPQDFINKISSKNLNEVVFAANDRKLDQGDEEILEKLRSLNLERGKVCPLVNNDQMGGISDE